MGCWGQEVLGRGLDWGQEGKMQKCRPDTTHRTHSGPNNRLGSGYNGTKCEEAICRAGGTGL